MLNLRCWYGMKTNWCHYFIRILLDLYMSRAHRPIFRRVRTAVHTTIGSVSVPLCSRALYVVAARLLRSWVRIPPGAWIFVCCGCRVLSGRGLCDELITRPEESYRLCCVIVCDLETSRMGAPYIYDISHLRVKCYVRGNQARVKNAELRHLCCTVVMYRRECVSPVHNVLNEDCLYLLLTKVGKAW